MSLLVDTCTRLNPEFSALDLVAQMDASGIERAVIMPSGPESAVYNAEGNARLISEWRRHADRFIPACTASPWRGGEAVGILRVAKDAGARLLVLDPAVQGFNLSDNIAEPLLNAADQLGLPVYVHTGPHSAGAPSQVILAAIKYPGVRFIIGHCGSTDHGWDMPRIAEYHLGTNVYLETSLARLWGLPKLIGLAPPDRVLFGTGAPLTDMAFETAQVLKLLPADAHPGFYGGNLLHLLGESG